MNKIIQILGIILLVVLLLLIRAFETELFYDPLISYFKNDYLHKVLPELKSIKLFGNILLRYLLNMIVSLGIIYMVFQNKKYIKFSIQFYGIAFIILSLIFYVILQTRTISYLPIFYIRRFLIQPIFVLLLIPTFYYQKQYVKT